MTYFFLGFPYTDTRTHARTCARARTHTRTHTHTIHMPSDFEVLSNKKCNIPDAKDPCQHIYSVTDKRETYCHAAAQIDCGTHFPFLYNLSCSLCVLSIPDTSFGRGALLLYGAQRRLHSKRKKAKAKK